jgi:regulator of replication initiation timing
MPLLELLFLIIVLCLTVWVFSLRRTVSALEREVSCQPPEKPGITPTDFKQLQTAMMELVQNIEFYTDSQIKKMQMQTEAQKTVNLRLNQQIEDLKAQLEELQFAVPEPEPYEDRKTSRIVPLTPTQNPIIHKSRDTILELYQKGWSYEKIAEQLRITKGEVQLVVKLS